MVDVDISTNAIVFRSAVTPAANLEDLTATWVAVEPHIGEVVCPRFACCYSPQSILVG